MYRNNNNHLMLIRFVHSSYPFWELEKRCWPFIYGIVIPWICSCNFSFFCFFFQWNAFIRTKVRYHCLEKYRWRLKLKNGWIRILYFEEAGESDLKPLISDQINMLAKVYDFFYKSSRACTMLCYVQLFEYVVHVLPTHLFDYEVVVCSSLG